MDVILFGPPGAGKGTQAAGVSEALGIPHVATGDIFRRHLRDGTELGELARRYMDAGQLVPDDVVVRIVATRLEEDDARGGVLFDGFPRTVAQAEKLADWLHEHGRRIDAVIDLDLADEVIVARLGGRRTCLSCGATYHVVANPPASEGVCDRCGGEVVQRDDDREETIRARLETYHRETAPVLAWLKDHARVHTVDAAQGIDQVRADILAALASDS